MLAIKNARVHTITRGIIEKGTVLVDGGKIVAVGPNVEIPAGAEVIDAAGRVLTPGLIDAHCHLGISEEGIGFEGEDTNEMTDPVTPHMRASPPPSFARYSIRQGTICSSRRRPRPAATRSTSTSSLSLSPPCFAARCLCASTATAPTTS